MKHLLILMTVLFFAFSCKKKSDDTTTEEPPKTTGSTYEITPVLSVKVNDTVYQCPSISCVSSEKTGAARFVILGDQSSKKHLFRLNFSSVPKPGTYSFSKDSDPSFTYSKDNTIYKVTSGSMTITRADTAYTGAISLLIATFDVKTDTTLPPQYPVYKLTEGKLNTRP